MTVYLKRRSAKELIYSYETRFIPSKVEAEDSFIFHFILKGRSGGKFTVGIVDKRLDVCDGLINKAVCIFKSSDKTFEDIELDRLSIETAIDRGLVQISDTPTFEKLIEALEKNS